MAGQVILAIAYGIDVAPRGDRNVEVAEKAVGAIIAGSLRGRIFDLFPFRTYEPSNRNFKSCSPRRQSCTHAVVVPWSGLQKGGANKMGTSCRDRTAGTISDSEATHGTLPFYPGRVTVLLTENMVGRGDSQAFRRCINDFRAQREIIRGRNIYLDGDTGNNVSR